jgi:hypothetical protein
LLPLFLLGQETIENWAAPPFWSARAPLAAPSEDGSVTPLAAEVIPSPPLPFVATNPCRIADTRGLGFTAQAGPPALSANTLRTFQVGGTVPGVTTQCGIPLSAQAVSFQFSVTAMNTAGNLIAWPEGPAPTTSVLNWNASSVAIGNGIVVPVSATGGLNVQLNGPAGATTQLIIDVNGYYGGSVVTSVTPGTGLTGGGTGAVTLGIAAGGVGTTELATGAVTSTKVAANAVTAGAIATNQVVKDLNGLRDSISLVGSGGTTVTPGTGTITISSTAGGGVPPGGTLLGNPGDTTLISAGFTEILPSHTDFWLGTSTVGAPSTRARQVAVWTGSKMIVWGGDTPSITNTGGRYDPVADSWSATTTMSAPVARFYHSGVWSGSRMIIWGGNDSGNVKLNTGGQYDPVGDSWTATTTMGAPVARELHTAIWTGSRMIVWGGFDASNPLNTGGQYNPADSWTVTTTLGAPSARGSHSAVWTGSKMIVWGGGSASNTGGQYDPADSWTTTTTTGAPQGRDSHTAVWTGTRMIVWGGLDPSNKLNNGGQYNPTGDAWTTTTTSGAPTVRYGHTAVWTGNRMVVFGGYDGAGATGTGGRYDPVSDFWTATTPGVARSLHTAVWTGTRMIVWGGFDSMVTRLNTGGRYGLFSLYLKN